MRVRRSSGMQSKQGGVKTILNIHQTFMISFFCKHSILDYCNKISPFDRRQAVRHHQSGFSGHDSVEGVLDDPFRFSVKGTGVVASSSRSIFGPFTTALAVVTLCFCPLDNCTPRSVGNCCERENNQICFVGTLS